MNRWINGSLPFWAWLIARTLGWTAAASIRYQNPPVDVVEMLAWGSRWEWGYYKHPPLPAWCAEMAAWARTDRHHCASTAVCRKHSCGTVGGWWP